MCKVQHLSAKYFKEVEKNDLPYSFEYSHFVFLGEQNLS